MRKSHIQTDAGQCGVDARPDPLAGNGEVLHAEGDVVADAGEDDLRLRILHDEADPTLSLIHI